MVSYRQSTKIIIWSLIVILLPFAASSVEGEEIIENPHEYYYFMNPHECFTVMNLASAYTYEACPGDIVDSVPLTKSYIRAMMATWMNAVLGDSYVLFHYHTGPTPSGAFFYLEMVGEIWSEK
ncbi:hypothetical protein ACFL4G_11015 [Thermodesulfobacteriota bacterium]